MVKFISYNKTGMPVLRINLYVSGKGSMTQGRTIKIEIFFLLNQKLWTILYWILENLFLEAVEIFGDFLILVCSLILLLKLDYWLILICTYI